MAREHTKEACPSPTDGAHEEKDRPPPAVYGSGAPPPSSCLMLAGLHAPAASPPGAAAAWCLYMAAVEPVSIVVLQLFMPLLLQELPRRFGHVAHHRGVPCAADEAACVVADFGRIALNGTAFSYAIITLSVALQALVFLCFGALADYSSWRRVLLQATTAAGALLCSAVLAIGWWGGAWPAAAAATLSVLITIAFGVSLMLYNSYLPLLVASHPAVLAAAAEQRRLALCLAEEGADAGPEGAAAAREARDTLYRTREGVANRTSTRSFMLGNGASIVLLVACAAYLFFVGNSFVHLQHTIALTGAWWGLGALYPLARLHSPPGMALPVGTNYLTFSVRKTFHTVTKCNRLPHTFRYLVAYFLFADGCNTIGQVAVIFARSVLHAPHHVLIACAILAPLCGVAGNYAFYAAQRALRLPSKAMLVAALGGIVVLALYGGAGVYFTSFGLRHVWELFMMACIYGFLMGAMQSLSRVIYAELIPPGEEAEFFALYAITDKGSSWIGPAMQAAITALDIDEHYGLLLLAGLIALPLPILIWGIDPRAGKRDALRFSSRAAECAKAPMCQFDSCDVPV